MTAKHTHDYSYLIKCHCFITKYKEHLHCYVTAYGAAAEKGVVVTGFIMADKADVIRYSDRNVEGC